MQMRILSLTEGEFTAEVLVSKLKVTVTSGLTNNDVITTWNSFPDPDNPGIHQVFAAVCEFNEVTNQAEH